MEFERVIITRVDSQQHREPVVAQNLYAEVVFLNKTHHSLQPLLYQMREDHFSLDYATDFPHSPYPHVESDAFTLVGEVLSVDRKKKEIYLNNQNTVSYRYLIVVTTPGDHYRNTQANEEQFNGGMQTLIDALRMRKNLFLPLPAAATQRPGSIKFSSSYDAARKQSLQNVTHDKILTRKKEIIALSLDQSDKKLYEVQI